MTVRSWKKSSHSQNGGDCVEVQGDLRAIRDSKNPGHSIHVDVRSLVNAVRSSGLDESPEQRIAPMRDQVAT